MNCWRLIPLLEEKGAFQMALDWWLLQQIRQNKHPSTLRFYTWSPAAISLGYHQSRWPNAWHDIIWQGVPLDIVRRPTGGRAVLHQGDLTYMVVTSEIAGKTTEVYQKICQFLIEGMRSLGVQLNYGEGGRGYINNSNCFATATGADLIDSFGNKLIGSAQLKQGKAILQHGSVILSRDNQLYRQVFGEIAPLPEKLPLQALVQALTESARDCFSIELIEQPLSDNEKKEILAITKTNSIYRDRDC